MKRALIVTVVVIFSVVAHTTPVFAATKVGDRCTKVGATSKVGSKTLVCGKDKKWQVSAPPKALAFIDKNPPEPHRVIVATPIASTERRIEKISEGWICLNGGQGVLQRLDENQWVDIADLQGWEKSTGCPAAWPLTPWTNASVRRGEVLRWRIFEQDAWEWFSNPFEFHEKRPRVVRPEKADPPLTAFNKVPVMARDAILSSPTFDVSNFWDIQFEESIPTKTRQYIVETANKAIPFISRFLLRSNEIHIVVFSSREWGLRKVLEFDTNDSPFKSQISKTFLAWGDRPKESCISVGGFTVGYFEHPVIAIDAPCEKWSDGSFAVVAHELLHTAQSKWAFSLGAACTTPAWWTEGQVRLGSFAFAQGDGSSKWYASRAESMRGMLNPRALPLKSFEQPYFNGEYSNGAAAMEYLVARSGWQATFDLLREADVIAGRSCLTGQRLMEVFREAFNNVYGQSLDDFYAEVAGYLAWTYDNISRL